MRASVTIALYAALCATSAPAAQAEPCASPQPEAGVPARVRLGPADFGSLPEACGMTTVSLDGTLGLLLDLDDYYGAIQAGGVVRSQLLVPGGSWFSLSFPGVDYRFVANATVEADSVNLSASTLGWHQPLRLSKRYQLAPYVRVLLPTETVFQNATRYGVEQGMSAVANLSEYLELTGGYAIPLLLTANSGSTHSVYLPTLTLDAGIRPVGWFQGVLGASVRFAPAEDEPLEGLDPRVALRLYPYRGLIIELAGAFPLFGRDRTTAAAGLSLGYMFVRH